MSFRNQVFAVGCAVTFFGVPLNLAAQQTTSDGVCLENAVNRAERTMIGGPTKYFPETLSVGFTQS